MGYLTVKQFSEKWGISERRIVNLCKEERISGAIKNGMVWMIPEDTVKPADKRSKIVQYINTEKRVAIIGNEERIISYLVPNLRREGYIVEVICDINLESIKNQLSQYYDGLIFIDLNEVTENKEQIINLFTRKMNCSSSVVLLNGNKAANQKLETKMSQKLKDEIGVTINSINLKLPSEKKFIINYDELSEDIICMLTKFKNTTGVNISTDGGCIEFNKNGKTKGLNTGDFYRAINNYLKKMNKNSTLWSASTMLEDEWTEEPLEMNFRVANLEAANRGANLERIFIFSKSNISKFRNNKTLNIYMQSNIKTMFVDYDEILEKEPELLEIIAHGWDGIDLDTLIVDLPEKANERGYISINKKEVQKAYECFKRLKYYSKDLKEVLK